MNPVKVEYMSPNNYEIKPAKDMNLAEISNWMALCNALKFINNTCELTGTYVEEKDINYRELLTYIEAVAGDISTCLSATKGIPLKYSLSNDTEDSKQTEEISYEFLDDIRR